jgi:DNA-binding NarL/FixJ family response regulator
MPEMAKRILIADDSSIIRKALFRLLNSEEGYDVCAQAEDGQEAIDLAQKHHPDLIIMDLSMPILNGLDASRELKRMMPDVPIILFTQHPHAGQALRDSNRTFDRVVSKIDVNALMREVKSLAPCVDYRGGPA